jgi:hypothetical protein
LYLKYSFEIKGYINMDLGTVRIGNIFRVLCSRIIELRKDKKAIIGSP